MRREDLLTALHTHPVIAAVKDDTQLQRAVASDAAVVFLLYGSITTLPSVINTLRGAGKLPFVHIDLVDGLAPREAAVDYIAEATSAAGIISTKPALLHRARRKGLLAVRRYFLLDSLSLQSIERSLQKEEADLIEILPGIMPKMLQKITNKYPDIPLIAGGLVSDKEDAINALSAGCSAVSTTNEAIWKI